MSSKTSLWPSRADYALTPKTWRQDLLAGITVGIVALPLALGFGISSGAGPEAGLITAIVAGVIAAVFGGSNVQVSGPTGAMVVVLAPIVAAQGLQAVVIVTLMAGVMVLGAGLLRLGRAVSFIPWPVIEGFTMGIGVIIFLQQIPALTGPNGNVSGHTNVVVAAALSLLNADPVYLMWALGAVAVVVLCMVWLPRLHPAIPGSLIAVILASVLAALTPNPLVTIGALPRTLPMPSLPAFEWGTLTSLLMPAVAVAALAAIESLLSARVAASMANTGPYDPDRELVGQGFASLGAGLFGGMPATGAIARTAVNVRSGGRTRLSAIVHALVLLAVVMVFAAPVGFIPLAALSGVLMVTAARMVNVSIARSILRSTRADAIAFIATAIVTVSVDLIVAVMVGMVLAGIFAIRAYSAAAGVHREVLPGEPQEGDQRIALIMIDGPLFFGSADRILEDIMDTKGVSVVILRLSKLDAVDASGANSLTEVVQRLEAAGITVLIKGLREQHLELFKRIGVISALRHPNHLFGDLESAAAHARSHVLRESAG
ncbi:SulP family inorganic anion transporter [Neomicrococcus aestuarii]|uniref:Sodium-independent anion transporter n=1 Tax=Neomicrococcus aestuarii TaxID=556325 RepID=A0A1L2ZP95_9MICC|nr:SulP family inorganic anion transporter [Neomicrococcus aestuarii]APF40882.1 sodium-independent anion transporter [Neomicrococcus aestuarii]